MIDEPTLPRDPRGMLCHRQDGGPSGCPKCGWRGVPVFRGKKRLNACPACERDILDEADGPIVAVKRPGRNEPCHCGSGKKYKKCHLPLDG
jgi:hypothetical protein